MIEREGFIKGMLATLQAKKDITHNEFYLLFKYLLRDEEEE